MSVYKLTYLLHLFLFIYFGQSGGLDYYILQQTLITGNLLYTTAKKCGLRFKNKLN